MRKVKPTEVYSDSDSDYEADGSPKKKIAWSNEQGVSTEKKVQVVERKSVLLEADQLMADEIKRRMKPTVVDGIAFNVASLGAILLNGVVIGLEVDSQFCDKAPRFFNPNAPLCAPNPLAGVPWQAFEFFFIFVFIVELGTRMYYHRENLLKPYPRFFEDWMNIFDGVLILVALADLVTAKAIRITLLFRFVRIARVANLLRLLRFFKPLFLFVVGSWDVLKTLFWIFPILLLLIYVFGIFTTEIMGVDDRLVPVFADPDTPLKHRRIGHTFTRDDYFGDIPKSIDRKSVV